jgi:nifR3 family TIM-barrel protein
LYEILKAVVKTAQTPVTVKIRAGWDEESVNARDIAMLAQDAGVNALIIHGRTQSQGYSGKVDYEEIRKVKEALNIPVIASGDAFSARLIKNIFEWTNCDGVAIARGALGNPWIFRETEHYLKFGELPAQHDLNELVDNMLFHLEMAIGADGELEGTRKFRKFFAWYVRGLHEARAFKARAFAAETQEQMAGLIDELKTSYFRTRIGE